MDTSIRAHHFGETESEVIVGHQGYYPDFQLPNGVIIAEPLHELLQELWSYRYDELYDDKDDGRVTEELWKVCDRLITFFVTYDSDQSHRRLVYLGWALALASAPKITHIISKDTESPPVFATVRAFLEEQQLPPANWSATKPPVPTGSQALNEARYVIVELAQALDPDHASQALLDMLDDCLEGYAIVVGSRYRRDLFNWLLVEVVPAAWAGRLPGKIYASDGPWIPSD